MSVQLLDRTRKINHLLQKTGGERIDFADAANVMAEVLKSNVLILSKRGKVLAAFEQKKIVAIEELISPVIGEVIDEQLNYRLTSILSTKENINLLTLGFSEQVRELNYLGMVIPIDVASERLGSLFMYRQTGDYDIEDLILAEYGATVVGLEIMRSINEEENEEQRKLTIVKSALATLSFSEQEAMRHIFNELGSDEGILVASRVADRAGITRSVIVNALRKFESAGVIESRSLGMKGTYIKIINDLVIDEIDRAIGER